MDNIENYRDALRAVQNKEIEQRKTIKKLLQDREELKKQLALYGVINWVACKDEIPLRRRVLMYMVKKNVKAIIIGGYTEENGWMSKGEKFTNNEITHWAELPKPPCL